jgi:PKD repeat protein
MDFFYLKFLLFTLIFFVATDAAAQCPVANSCTPGNAVDLGVGCGIFNVTFNTINNTTGGVADGFKDYSCTQGTSLIFGINYNLSIQTGNTYPEDVRIWIDYNNDGTFDVVNELAFSSDNKTTHTGVINIPSTAVLNQALRMRIASDYGTALASPCSTSQYSQSEDYRIIALTNTNSPTANFLSSDTLTCAGSVTFQDLSLNGPTSWKWYFGDGDSSSLQNPTHAYSSGGYYTVTLIATNSVGSNTKSITNYIHFSTSIPIASTCTPLTSNYCCGYGISNVTFNTINNSSTDASEGYKDFTCSRKTIVQQGKKYSITITTSGTNNQDSKIFIDFNNDGSFNNTNELVFQSYNTVSPSGMITIPGTVVLNTPLRMRVMSDYAGSAYDACTYLDKGQAEDYTISITPNTSAPIVYFSVDTALSCQSSFVFADSSDNGPTSWMWDFGDGVTSAAQSPGHSYAASGNYSVRLKACNSIGCDSLTKLNYISFLPQCYCTATGNSNSLIYINNLTFGTINNYSGQDANGYGDYTSVSSNVLAGNSYNLSINASSYYEYFSAWIDYNKDGAFSSSEQILTSAYSSFGSSSGSIIIPSSASTGTTRMRVLVSYYSSEANSPCGGNLSYGEVEDYMVNIVSITQPPLPDFSSTGTVTCTSPVSFTDATTGNVTSRLWNFGDGTTSTLQNPSHTYSSYGNYTVKLKTCNSYGCDSIKKNNYINYSAACPYCTSGGNSYSSDYIAHVGLNTINNYTVQSASGYGNYTSVSTNLTQGVNYTLNISDGNYSGAYYDAWIDYNKDGVFSNSEQIISSYQYGYISASFTVPGTASVGIARMRVTLNTSNSSTSCQTYFDGEVEDYTINILQNTAPPVTYFYSANAATCSPSVAFTDSSANVVTSWLWDFGDGTTSTLQNPSHTYSSYGNYTVKLKTCNGYGCDSITKNNYIKYSTTCTYCTSTGNNNTSGDYISNVTFGAINNSSGKDANGYGDYTSVSTNILSGNSYNLSISSGTYYEYFSVWIDYNKDGVFSSAEQVITSAYSYSSYSASIVIPSNASRGTTRMRVLVSYYSNQASAPCGGKITYGEVEDYTVKIISNTQPPLPDFSSTSTITCTSSVSFTDATAGTVTSRFWNFGDGTTSALQNPSHTYSGYGNYTVKLKTCNSYGCDSITKNNYINYSATCPYCIASGNNNTFGDYISNVTFGTINNSSGKDANGYGNYTSVSANMHAGSSYNLSISSGTYSEYFSAWIDYNMDGLFSSSEQIIISAYHYGTYSAYITIPANTSTGATRMRVLVSYNSSQANMACGGNLTYGEVEDYTINLASATGIRNAAAFSNSLIVSPNPNNGIFDVNINLPVTEDLTLQIMNTMGETVKEDVLPSGNSFTRSYDLSGLASGMYFVKLIIGQETVVIKKIITE